MHSSNRRRSSTPATARAWGTSATWTSRPTGGSWPWITPPPFSFAGLFKGEGVVIPWGAVVMMGEDVILVNLPGGPRESDPKM